MHGSMHADGNYIAHLSADVTLTICTVGRPKAVRPITGETVVFSCEVRSSSGILWQSSTIEDIVFVRAIHDVNEVMSDGDAGTYIPMYERTTTINCLHNYLHCCDERS